MDILTLRDKLAFSNFRMLYWCTSSQYRKVFLCVISCGQLRARGHMAHGDYKEASRARRGAAGEQSARSLPVRVARASNPDSCWSLDKAGMAHSLKTAVCVSLGEANGSTNRVRLLDK